MPSASATVSIAATAIGLLRRKQQREHAEDEEAGALDDVRGPLSSAKNRPMLAPLASTATSVMSKTRGRLKKRHAAVIRRMKRMIQPYVRARKSGDISLE